MKLIENHFSFEIIQIIEKEIIEIFLGKENKLMKKKKILMKNSLIKSIFLNQKKNNSSKISETSKKTIA